MKKSEFRELIRESIIQVLVEKKTITTEKALLMAKRMRASNKVDIEELRRGMEIEQEHLKTIGGFSYRKLARIALDHLKEVPDYYTRLDKMENEAKTQREGWLSKYYSADPDKEKPTNDPDAGKKANEISTTASAPGFMTPKAFQGPKRKTKKKKN